MSVSDFRLTIAHPRIAAEQHSAAVAKELERLFHKPCGEHPENDAKKRQRQIQQAFLPPVRNRVDSANVNGIKVATRVDGVASDDRQCVNRRYLIIEIAGVPFHHLVNNLLMGDVL